MVVNVIHFCLWHLNFSIGDFQKIFDSSKIGNSDPPVDAASEIRPGTIVTKDGNSSTTLSTMTQVKQ